MEFRRRNKEKRMRAKRQRIVRCANHYQYLYRRFRKEVCCLECKGVGGLVVLSARVLEAWLS